MNRRYGNASGSAPSRKGRGRPGRGEIMIVQGGSGAAGDFAYVLGALGRAGWRYRSELAPLYWWAGSLLGGAWLHSTHPAWWPLPLVAGVAVLVVLAWLPRPVVTRWPLLARWRVRAWSAGFTAAVTATVALAGLYGASAGELPTYAFMAAMGLGAPWWWREDRRRLSKVRMIRERFGDTADAAGLSGARMVSAVIGRWGWTARLKLRRGQHYTDAVNALPALESALGSRVGALRVEPVTDDAAEVVLRLVESDPHAEPIPWVARPGKRPASITAPVTVGVWEDGSDVAVSLLRKHVLIGGATDSGKSGLLNVILARLAECNDVTIWGIDLKEGMELAPWSKVLHRLAVNGSQGGALLKDAVAELERRAAFLAEQGIREWTPTAEAPALVVMIDEYAELGPAARKLADSIARRGRAVAVTLLIATQRPTQKTMGDGSAIRSQMNIRFCLRVVERGDVDLILGAGSLTAGWDTTGFDAPGKFLLRAAGHDTPRRARAQWINDADVQATATRNTRPNHHQPARPQDRNGDHASGQTPPGTTGAQDGAPGSLRAPGATGTPSGVSGPDVALWEALKQAPPTGAGITELMTASGRSRRWVHYRLQALKRQGKAAPCGDGRWVAVPGPRARPDREPPGADGDAS
ncbi:cell division protein FtsK [Kribbella qitaiheensis]|uniref:Cell division protein FtsK n=2 Tax=Kribbella qitaiheensis TaxID=1544730 RepID=A0A7G6WY15_9ACTN|nr:cell division protein FtsK [Kribbella qitaiheensis]